MTYVYYCAWRPCFIDCFFLTSDFCQVPCRNFLQFFPFLVHPCFRCRVHQIAMMTWIVPCSCTSRQWGWDSTPHAFLSIHWLPRYMQIPTWNYWFWHRSPRVSCKAQLEPLVVCQFSWVQLSANHKAAVAIQRSQQKNSNRPRRQAPRSLCAHWHLLVEFCCNPNAWLLLTYGEVNGGLSVVKMFLTFEKVKNGQRLNFQPSALADNSKKKAAKIFKFNTNSDKHEQGQKWQGWVFRAQVMFAILATISFEGRACDGANVEGRRFGGRGEKGGPALRHVSKSHRVAFDWLFDRTDLDSKIKNYIPKTNLLTFWPKGKFHTWWMELSFVFIQTSTFQFHQHWGPNLKVKYLWVRWICSKQTRGDPCWAGAHWTVQNGTFTINVFFWSVEIWWNAVGKGKGDISSPESRHICHHWVILQKVQWSTNDFQFWACFCLQLGASMFMGKNQTVDSFESLWNVSNQLGKLWKNDQSLVRKGICILCYVVEWCKNIIRGKKVELVQKFTIIHNFGHNWRYQWNWVKHFTKKWFSARRSISIPKTNCLRVDIQWHHVGIWKHDQGCTPRHTSDIVQKDFQQDVGHS